MAGADPERLKLIGSVYADLGRMLTEVVRKEGSGSA